MRLAARWIFLLIGVFALIGSAAADDWLYLTYPGDTLIGIGKRYLKNPRDWPKIQSLNNVPIPRHLPVNTHLRIPVKLLKVTPAPVTVTSVRGNVRVKPRNALFHRLKAGEKLTGGETVITSFNSLVGYRLADGSTLTQAPSSKLVFGRLAAYGATGMVSTELKLEGGRLEADASKQVAPAGGFRVITPVAVAGLRGTAFRLNMDDDTKTLRSEVLRGDVAVSAQGREVDVAAGYGTITEQGRPPSKPRPLPPAPRVQGLPARVLSLPLRFSWTPATPAFAWRAQVATDAAFQNIVLDGLFRQTEAHWETDLPDGDYFLRLRRVDANGMEGLNLDHPFTLDARPIPPVPTSPQAGERELTPQVTLTWAAAPEAQGYLFQVSPHEDFGAGVIERRLGPVLQHQETLAPARYYWRLASLDDKGMPHGWSTVSSFVVQPPPAAPTPTSSVGDGHASFAWNPVTGAEHYQIQVGDTAELTHPQHALDTQSPSATVALAPGKYWWRVRGVEQGGLEGAWSQTAPVVLPPAAPVLTQIPHADRLLAPEIPIAWQPSDGAQTYRLQVATGVDFHNPILDTTLTDIHYRFIAKAPGHYFCRVAAIGADKVSSPWSASLALRYEPPPPAPAHLQAKAENRRLAISWTGQAASYRVDLATDRDFHNLVGQHKTQAQEILLDMPATGMYFARVVAYDGEGVPSKPSAVLPIEIFYPFPWWFLPFVVIVH